MDNTQELRQLLESSIEQFNSRQFFQCHETLESAWRKYHKPDRIFIQGLIQIAVGYHHLINKNYVGAKKLFKQGLAKMLPFGDSYMGIDISSLEPNIKNLLDHPEYIKQAQSVVTPQLRILKIQTVETKGSAAKESEEDSAAERLDARRSGGTNTTERL